MKNRIYLFDNLKFLLIMTVVIGHCIDYMTGSSNIMKSLFLFIYSFHMPLFIYLSGLFHSNHNVKNRCICFIFIGYAMKIFLCLTKLFLFHKASFSLLSDGGIPWFMFTLAMFTACSYFLRNIDIRKIFLLAFLLACVIGYDKSVGDYLYLSRFIIFYPFYLLGQMTDRNKLFELTHKKSLKLLSFAGIMIWGFLCIKKLNTLYFLRPLFTGRHSFSSNPIFEVNGFFYRILCMIITLLIGFFLLCLVPDRRIPFVTDAGRRTLQVYFWHRPIVYFMDYLKIHEILKISFTGKILWILIGVILTIILSTTPFSFPIMNIQKAFNKPKSAN